VARSVSPLVPAPEEDTRARGTSEEGVGMSTVGHNLPQEAPEEFADAVLTVGGLR